MSLPPPYSRLLLGIALGFIMGTAWYQQSVIPQNLVRLRGQTVTCVPQGGQCQNTADCCGQTTIGANCENGICEPGTVTGVVDGSPCQEPINNDGTCPSGGYSMITYCYLPENSPCTSVNGVAGYCGAGACIEYQDYCCDTSTYTCAPSSAPKDCSSASLACSLGCMGSTDPQCFASCMNGVGCWSSSSSNNSSSSSSCKAGSVSCADDAECCSGFCMISVSGDVCDYEESSSSSSNTTIPSSSSIPSTGSVGSAGSRGSTASTGSTSSGASACSADQISCGNECCVITEQICDTPGNIGTPRCADCADSTSIPCGGIYCCPSSLGCYSSAAQNGAVSYYCGTSSSSSRYCEDKNPQNAPTGTCPSRIPYERCPGFFCTQAQCCDQP